MCLCVCMCVSVCLCVCVYVRVCITLASTGSSGHTVASPQPSSLSAGSSPLTTTASQTTIVSSTVPVSSASSSFPNADTMSVAGLDWDDSEPVSLSLSDVRK